MCSPIYFGGFGGLFGGGAACIGGAYANTAEGKVIVAAFLDSYSNVVTAVKNYKAQTVKGGLGTGGHLAVQGAHEAQTSASTSASSASPTPSMSIADAQAKLNSLGFNVGQPDGAMGQHTHTQLRAFQRSRGLPQTGALDSATINALNK